METGFPSFTDGTGCLSTQFSDYSTASTGYGPTETRFSSATDIPGHWVFDSSDQNGIIVSGLAMSGIVYCIMGFA